MKFGTVLLGLGNVGWLYDKNLDIPLSLTHFSAIQRHSDLFLVGADDINLATLREFNLLNNLKMEGIKVDKETDVDLVIIASPTITHFEVFEQCISLKPKVVLMEKPICFNELMLKNTLELADNNNVKLFVNFQRYVDPALVQTAKEVKNGKYGSIEHVSCISSGPLKSSGPHMLNLIRLFLEPFIGDSKVRQVSPSTFLIETSSLEINYSIIETRNFFFRVEFFSKIAHILYDAGKGRVQVARSRKSEYISKELKYDSSNVSILETTEDFSIVYDQLVKYLTDGSSSLCTAQESLWEHLMLFKMIEEFEVNEKI